MKKIKMTIYLDNSFLSMEAYNLIKSHSNLFEKTFKTEILTHSDLMQRNDVRKCCGGPKFPWLEIENIISAYKGKRAIRKLQLLIKQNKGE